MRLLLAAVLVALAGAAGLATAAPVDAPRTIASGLAVPWDVVGLPDGRVLIPERSLTRIRVLAADGTLRPEPAWSDPTANKVLGIEPHPQYATNRWIYAYVTYDAGSRVIRLTDDGTNLVNPEVVFPGPIPTDGSHDGGRIRFGPDGKLYVTTGDVHDPALPRDRSSLNGKILRLNADGSAPADNPFVAEGGNARFVWSYGHRHPQGIAWDANGLMWESEHGPSNEPHAPDGEKTGNDEINRIVKGGDYGWPDSAGARAEPGTIAPAWVAGDVAVAPGGMVFAPDGRLYVPMLAGQHLHVYLPRADGTLADEGQLFPGTRLRAASMIGCTLAFTTDRRSGATDEVRAATIAPCAPAPAPSPTPGPAPPPPPTDPPAGPAAPSSADGRTVLRRIRRALRERPRGRVVRVRVNGLPDGRLRVRVRHARTGRLVARGSTASATLRLRTTRLGRRLLRRARPARLRATLRHPAMTRSGGRIRIPRAGR